MFMFRIMIMLMILMSLVGTKLYRMLCFVRNILERITHYTFIPHTKMSIVFGMDRSTNDIACLPNKQSSCSFSQDNNEPCRSFKDKATKMQLDIHVENTQQSNLNSKYLSVTLMC